MGRVPRRAVVTVVVLAALLALVVVADLLVTRRVEARLAHQAQDALGFPVDVDLRGWPVALRILSGFPVDATVADDAADRELDVLLSEAEVEASIADLLDPGRPVRVDVPRVRAVGVLPPGSLAPGTRVQALASDVLLEASQGRTEARARTVQITTPDGGRTRALLEAVEVEERGDQARGRAARAVIRTEGGVLPIPAERAEIRMQDVYVREGGAVGARDASVDARGVALEGEDITLDRLDARLPRLRLVPRGSGVTATTRGGRFEAVLDEDALNDAWRFPGRVELADNAVRLRVAGFAATFDVRVEAGALVLDPRLPGPLRLLLGSVPPLRVRPALPQGATLEQATVDPPHLVLTGAVDELHVPVDAR